MRASIYQLLLLFNVQLICFRFLACPLTSIPTEVLPFMFEELQNFRHGNGTHSSTITVVNPSRTVRLKGSTEPFGGQLFWQLLRKTCPLVNEKLSSRTSFTPVLVMSIYGLNPSRKPVFLQQEIPARITTAYMAEQSSTRPTAPSCKIPW